MKNKIITVQELPPGTNSKIFKAITKNGKVYCIKCYLSRVGDKRNRLKTEFSALTFLWKHGIRNIPQPIAKFTDMIALYSFISGKVLRETRVSDKELAQAIDVLETIHSLRIKASSKQFSRASEASLSFLEFITAIEAREQKLKKASDRFDELRKFLIKEWEPVWKKVLFFVHGAIDHDHLSLTRRLPRQFQTLSPSDFGFHNAIRGTHGHITFIDFEYFGWDDPAKLISDLLLHPGMNLTKKQKQLFLKKSLAMYGNDPTLAKRLPLVYVLLGLKWSLIMLNCFFDGATLKSTARRQLAKARKNLTAIDTLLNRPRLLIFL